MGRRGLRPAFATIPAMGDRQAYVLGGQEHEIARLDAQSAFYEAATSSSCAGVGSSPGCASSTWAAVSATSRGCRGDRRAGRRSDRHRCPAPLLEIARQRTTEAGHENIRSVEADVRTTRAGPLRRRGRPSDSVPPRGPGRRRASPRRSTRAQRGRALRSTSTRSPPAREPLVELAQTARDYVLASFRRAGADPVIGTRLAVDSGRRRARRGVLEGNPGRTSLPATRSGHACWRAWSGRLPTQPEVRGCLRSSSSRRSSSGWAKRCWQAERPYC